jgi:hypothetical protein
MKFLFSLLLFLSVNLTAGITDLAKEDSLYLSFSSFAYNFDFENAEQIANNLIDDFPQSPYGYHAEALLNMWYYMGSRDEGDAKVFLKFSDLALQKFENYSNRKESALLDYRIGEEYMFRTILFLFLHKRVKSFWNLKKAVTYFKSSKKLEPKFIDGYLGIGLFEYSLVYAPAAIKAGLFLVGLSADEKKGISHLKAAAAGGLYAQDEAEFQLSKIYSDYYFDINESNKYLIPLLKKYPNNIFFKYQYAVNLIKAKQFSEAIEEINRILEFGNKHFVQLKAFSFFLKGEVRFMQNDFKGAIESYENYFQFARSAEFLGYANYKEGLSYLFLGDTLKAREDFLLAQNGEEDNFKDNRASKISLEYLEKNLQNINLPLIFARNLVEAGKYYDAVKAFETVAVNSESERKEKLIYTAEAFLGLKDFHKAKESLTEAGKTVSDDNYRNTYLLYLFSKYYLLTNKPVQFHNYFEKALEADCDSYELKAKIRGLGEL